MISSKISITEYAEEDLFNIWTYIAVENQNPENAERFLGRLQICFESLAKTPGLGVSKNEYALNLLQYPFGAYLIFYKSFTTGIEIFRIIHGSRDLTELF